MSSSLSAEEDEVLLVEVVVEVEDAEPEEDAAGVGRATGGVTGSWRLALVAEEVVVSEAEEDWAGVGTGRAPTKALGLESASRGRARCKSKGDQAQLSAESQVETYMSLRGGGLLLSGTRSGLGLVLSGGGALSSLASSSAWNGGSFASNADGDGGSLLGDRSGIEVTLYNGYEYRTRMCERGLCLQEPCSRRYQLPSWEHQRRS